MHIIEPPRRPARANHRFFPARRAKSVAAFARHLAMLAALPALVSIAVAQPVKADNGNGQRFKLQAQKAASAGISRKLLDKRPVAGAPGLETQLWLIEYPPGATAPSHHHPVVGIGYVLEGAFDSAFATEPLTHVAAGQSFVDPAQVEHEVFRNASATEPLRFLIAYTIPSGSPIVEVSPTPRLQWTPKSSPVAVDLAALYPETIELNPKNNKFLVGSLREGAVYEVSTDGKVKALVQDERLTAVLGIAVHAASNRLIVTNSDLGLSVRHSKKGAKKEAGVGFYDLTSGKALRYVDLTQLLPEGEHLINGIALDREGNAYVTDSFSPAIYKIDSKGVASVLLQADDFKGPGVNLNGLAYHAAGFLLAVQKSNGVLYRIPIADPKQFTRVHLSKPLVGADGLNLIGTDQLLVIANKTPAAASEAAWVLNSSDNWQSAELTQTRKLGSNYPTTSVTQDGKLYVLSSHLDEWLGAKEETRAAVLAQGRKAEILELGVIETGSKPRR